MRPESPRQVLDQANAPAFIITDLVNIRYLTGMSLTAGMILVTPRRFVLFLDPRYRNQGEKLVSSKIQLRDFDDLERELSQIPECGFEGEDVTVLRKSLWKRKFKNTKFIQRVGVIQEFRRSKEEDELKFMRRAHRITKEILRRVPSMFRSAVTEEKLARQLNVWALELGAEGLAFDPIVAFGTNTSNPHHIPTSRTLKKGHIVQIDVGAKFKGYCADLSRVFFTAPPSKLHRSVYSALCDAQEKVMLSVRPGASAAKLDGIARGELNKAGLEKAFTHALGHGVGLEIHEGVSLSGKSKAKLLSGEVITVEPGAYFPGKFGMRVEEMVFVS